MKGRKVGAGLFTECPISPQSRAYSRWRGIRLNWFPSQRNVTCDENLWRDNKKIMVSMRHTYKRLEGEWAPSPGIWVAACLVPQRSPSPIRKHWPTAVHRGVPKKPREQKEKRILFSSSVVAKGTRSASLCCDWIIILLLIHVVYVFSVDSFQRGRELCVIQQDGINPKKASQRSPGEQAGGRASRQILGDATATGRAGQSHMAPGQTGRKAITYSLMSHPPFPSIPLSFLKS